MLYYETLPNLQVVNGAKCNRNIFWLLFVTPMNCFNVGTLQDIKFAVHAHPTLSEVLDELFKLAKACF